MSVRKRSAKELLATAYHEAGHAVAHCELKVPFSRLTIKDNGDELGHVLHRRMSKQLMQGLEISFYTPAQRDRTERLIICALAGAVAERRYTGRWNNVGASFDRSKVTDLVLRIADGPRSAQAYIKWLEVRTDELFERPGVWAAVERIAAAAIDQTTLSAQCVYEAWRPARPLSKDVLAQLAQIENA